METAPKLSTIIKSGGIADQVAYSVNVTYQGEDSRRVTFVGYLHSGPVIMCSESAQTFATDPGRLGAFGPQWVRNFFERA